MLSNCTDGVERIYIGLHSNYYLFSFNKRSSHKKTQRGVGSDKVGIIKRGDRGANAC